MSTVLDKACVRCGPGEKHGSHTGECSSGISLAGKVEKLASTTVAYKISSRPPESASHVHESVEQSSKGKVAVGFMAQGKTKSV